MIQIDNRQRQAKAATGASLYGNNLSDYPSRLVDAFTVIQSQIQLEENARIEAEQSYRKK